MKIVLIVLCELLFFLGGCGNVQSENESASKSENASNKENSMETNINDDKREDVAESKESIESKENEMIDQISQLDISWLSEEYMEELRVGYYGKNALNLDVINEAITEEGTKFRYYRIDDVITSCVAFNKENKAGITTVTATGDVLDFSQIWKDYADIYDLIK